MTEAWNPAHPKDALAERYRLEMTEMALRTNDAAIFRDMSPGDRLEAQIHGVLTGLVGICFASVDKRGRKRIMRYLADYLPHARRQIECILDAESAPASSEQREK